MLCLSVPQYGWYDLNGVSKSPLSVLQDHENARAVVAQPGVRSPARSFFLAVGWGHPHVMLERPFKMWEQHLLSMIPLLGSGSGRGSRGTEDSPCSSQSKESKDRRAQARLIVLSVTLNAKITPWIDGIQFISWAEELSFCPLSRQMLSEQSVQS